MNVNKSLPAKNVTTNNAHNTLSEIRFIFAIWETLSIIRTCFLSDIMSELKALVPCYI